MAIAQILSHTPFCKYTWDRIVEADKPTVSFIESHDPKGFRVLAGTLTCILLTDEEAPCLQPRAAIQGTISL